MGKGNLWQHADPYLQRTVRRELYQPVSLIMADVDHFKKVNDTYGHRTGDVVLLEIAKILQSVAEASGGCAGG